MRTSFFFCGPHLNLTRMQLWCVQMYKLGHCPNYQYVYRNRQAPPAICITQRDWRVPAPLVTNSDSPPFPYVIALALVPPEGRTYLPAPFARFMHPDSPVGKLLSSRSGHIDLSRIAAAVSAIPLAEFAAYDHGALFFGATLQYRRRLPHDPLQGAGTTSPHTRALITRTRARSHTRTRAHARSHAHSHARSHTRALACSPQ